MSHFDANPGRPKRIAIVLADPGVSSVTQQPVGFWWSELTHPWLAFREAGHQVELFSPSGGACQADSLSDPRDASGYSEEDIISLGFITSPATASLVESTRPANEASPEDFDAIVIAGGQSPMFTFGPDSPAVMAVERFWEAGRIVAALCHGTAALKWAKDSSGQPLAQGRTVTGFADCEEDFADEAMWSAGWLPQGVHLMPWRIEPALKKLGANYVQGGRFRAFAVRDGRLITGQQNFSGAATAKLVLEALGV